MKQLLLLTTLFASSFIISAQTSDKNTTVACQVHKVYPSLSVASEDIPNINSVADIKSKANNQNHNYKAEWIKEVLYVSVNGFVKGIEKTITGTSVVFSPEQKQLITSIDDGSEIFITIDYIPNNTLENNTPQKITFSFVVEPDEDAAFLGGEAALDRYLATHIREHLSPDDYTGLDLSIVKFIINESGEVESPEIVSLTPVTTEGGTKEALLLKAIGSMPCWKPASYKSGTPARQQYALTVGNMQNCTSNLVNIAKK